ncbi:unnamed protein product [Camellia sinensis]
MADSLNTGGVDSSRGEVDVVEGKKGSEFMKVVLVGQRTVFLVNQSEQGDCNDAANSVPVANPVVPEKKTWASVVATNQRSAVKLRLQI